MRKIIFILVAFLYSGNLGAQENNMMGISFAPLVEKLSPGVVNISTLRTEPANSEKADVLSTNEYIRDYFLQDEGGKTSLGSGFLIDSKGYIVTNNHVIDKANEIIVTLYDDSQYNAVVIGSDKMTDLALIKIEADKPLPFVEFGNSDELKVGDWILAIGNPFGLGGSVTAGIVSAKSRDIDAGSYDNFIQTDASINQGSSGGPMFNMQGKVVGINTAIFSSTGASMGVGFATPINLSKFVIEQLVQKGKVERGWIGIKGSTSSKNISLSANQNFSGGVMVNSLSDNSPATKAGIEAGDIIISINGNDIKDIKSFSRLIAETNVGTPIILRLWRNNLIKDIEVTVALMPEIISPSSGKIAAPEKPLGYVEELGLVTATSDNGDIKITEVLADSDAVIKGIKSGDIIRKIDGQKVSSMEDIRSYVAYALAEGRAMIEVEVISDGIIQNLRLKVSGNDQG